MRKKNAEKPGTGKPCAIEGCPFAGDYKAPKSRFNLTEYQYLCLEHIQAFNQAWDYFAGWSQKQIEDFMDDAMRGHRPTWQMSEKLAHSSLFFSAEHLRDNFFDSVGKKAVVNSYRLTQKQREAFVVLDLEPDSGIARLKSHYKKLVKQCHPDVNKGNKALEEKFKQVSAAYKELMLYYGSKNEK